MNVEITVVYSMADIENDCYCVLQSAHHDLNLDDLNETHHTIAVGSFDDGGFCSS